jgi:hypothetical protein
MTVFREWVSEIDADRLATAEQFARYGLAQCCECRRFLPKRYLGPLDPLGQQRCANWSDCRDARDMAEACLFPEREITAAVDAEPSDEEEFELLAAW